MSIRDTRAATELPSGEAVTAVAEGRALLVVKRESGGRMTFPDHASYIRYQRARAQVQLRQQFRAARAPVPATVPEPPTALIGTSALTGVTVLFTPGANGGSTITGYKYSTDGATYDTPASQTATSVTITGLTTGTTYTIRLKATNAIGDSLESAALLIAPLPGSGLRLFLDGANITNTSDTVWPDAGGQTLDATLTGASGEKPTWSSANSGILTFAGTNQYAYLPAGFADFTSGITIMAFVNFGSANNWERIIDFGNGDASHNILLARAETLNDLKFENYSGGTISLSATLSGGVINDGWGFYAVRSDGTSYKILNQLTDLSASPSALPTNVIRTNNYIGRSNWSADAYFSGKMGIIAIYNTALSDSDITAFYNLYKTRYFTVPSAPTGLSVIPKDSSVSIEFTAPTDNGGVPIINYEYSVNNGSSWTAFSPTIVSSPVTITSLTNGTVYPIKLRAVNSIGAGAASSTVSVSPIPSTFSPRSISESNVWLDGISSETIVLSSGKVSAWNDKSAASVPNDFTVLAAGQNITYVKSTGINARPSIYFTERDIALIRRANISDSNQISLFMVVQQINNPTNQNSELFFVSAGNPVDITKPYKYFDLFSNTGPSGSGLLSFNIGSETQLSTGIDIITSPPRTALISVVIDSVNANIFVDGSGTSVSNTPRGSEPNYSDINKELTWAISRAAFIGYVGEVVTYNKALTETQRQHMEGYLAWKWGLQENLPIGHPFFPAPPSATVPTAPTNVIAEAGNAQASVTFSTPTSTGGLPITSYTVTSNPGNITATGGDLPITVTGLTNDTSYTFTVVATNALGDSVASFPSAAVIPSSTKIVEFKSVGSTTWTAPIGVTSIEYLVVGGGGGSGGGYDTGGGGGGGGGSVKTGVYTVIPEVSYDITVGSGGIGSTVDRTIPKETNGLSGSNSEFDSIVAFGGGGGFSSRLKGDSSGGLAAQENAGSFGGSGGGSAADGNGAGGGGGGASGNGFPGVSNNGGNGGIGITSSINGTTIIYGAGGRGANGASNNDASQGPANTGQGAKGGGATSGNQRQGASGGSGIVILKYTLP